MKKGDYPRWNKGSEFSETKASEFSKKNAYKNFCEYSAMQCRKGKIVGDS